MNCKVSLSTSLKDDDDNLVGIRIKKANTIEVIFPIGYKLKESKVKYTPSNKNIYDKEIKNLIRWLSLSKNYDKKEPDINNFDFISAFEIIDDFYDLGLYKETVELVNNTSGKINWKNTIKENKLNIYCNCPLTNITYNKINYHNDGIISSIQKYCLGLISKVIGIFYNFNYPTYNKPFATLTMQKILKEEMTKTNIDNKKKCLQHLLDFINNTYCINDINGNKVIEYGTKKFHPIWQQIIDIKFNGTKDKSKYYPRAYYVDKNLEKISKIIDPSIPDTIIEKEDCLIVLDAKYYKINRYPNEYDINKQLRYAKYCSQKIDNNKIYNIFILPNELDYPYYKIESFATNESVNDEKIYLKYVALCYIDTKYILNNDMPDVLDKIIAEIKGIYKS